MWKARPASGRRRFRNRRRPDAGLAFHIVELQVAIFVLHFEELGGNAGEMNAVDGGGEGAHEFVEVVRQLGPGTAEVAREQGSAEAVDIDAKRAPIERSAAQQSAGKVAG